MHYTYSFRPFSIENNDAIVGYMGVQTIVSKNAVRVRNEEVRSTLYWCSETQKIGVEEDSVVRTETTTKSPCMILFQAAFEKLFEL